MSAHSANHFDDRITTLSLINSRIRKTNSLTTPEVLDAMPSTVAEMHSDWIGATSRCVCDMITSNHNPLSDKSCFDRLALLWLDDLKSFNAYNVWCARWSKDGIWSTPIRQENDYYAGCRAIHDWLLKTEHKHDPSRFAAARCHIEERYLNEGRIQFQKPDVEKLIGRKAARIWETTGDSDELQNWTHAQDYVEAFYGNIVPAIENNDRSNVYAVLKALQSDCKTGRLSILVNGFEAALAIHFLDPDSVRTFEKRAGPVF